MKQIHQVGSRFGVLAFMLVISHPVMAQAPTHDHPICGVQRDDNRPNACGGGATVGVSSCSVQPNSTVGTYVSCSGVSEEVTIEQGPGLIATCLEYHSPACTHQGKKLVPQYVGAKVPATGRVVRSRSVFQPTGPAFQSNPKSIKQSPQQ